MKSDSDKELMDEYWAYRARMDRGGIVGRVVLGVIAAIALLGSLGAWVCGWLG